MTTCSKCGSDNITVQIPEVLIVQQLPNGIWIADGRDRIGLVAAWQCGDCGLTWAVDFTEPYLDREDAEDEEDDDEITEGNLPEERS